MTLGRTEAGLIKIKTGDSGLRAVSCGCCGGQGPSGPCGGCPTFEDLTGATSVGISHTPTGADPVGGYFDMVDPFTAIEYVIEDGMQGTLVTGQSSACGAQISQNAYGFTRFAGFQISRQDGVCVAGIFSGGSGGNGADFSVIRQGSITVPVSQLFGTHSIPETGEACQAIFEFDEETQETINVGSCYPIESSSTVTIS
jgi:hypothetical protein